MNTNSVNALLNENTEYMVMQNQTKPLIKKWKKTGLLEGLENQFEVAGMAVMLENQAKRLIAEATTTSGASNSEAWSGVALPLVRRIFGEIAAKDFVSVQPMNLPSGLVFFLDFKYSGTNSQPGFTAGTSLFGGTSTTRDANFGRTDSATNGLYGAGRFGFTSNELSYTGTVTTSSITLADLNNDSVLWNGGNITGSYKKVTVALSNLPGYDANAVRATVLEAGTVTGVTYYPQFTKIVGSNLVAIASGSGALGAAGTVKFNYLVAPVQDSRGDFEDLNQPWSVTGPGGSSTIAIPQIDLQMKSEPIVAKTKKLKAQWTPEMAQDLNAYHSIDAEAELTSILSEYISMEIDLEILDMLIGNALTTERWSAINNRYWNGSAWVGGGASTTEGLGFYNQQGTWFATLGTKLRKVSNTIHQLTMRGGANFAVVSPQIATILDSIPGYGATDRGEKMKFAMGVQKVGNLANQYDVYVNPYMTENLILLGFRGSQFLETGAVYSPYIPLMMTPLVYDPTTYTPNRGVMTRYAKKMLRPEFYGLIQVEGLETL
jgi:hypothetical protein